MTDDSLANKHEVLYHRYLIFNNSMTKIYKAGLTFLLSMTQNKWLSPSTQQESAYRGQDIP